MIFVITLAILFIIRIFAARNKNIYNYLENKYGRPVVIKYRQFVKSKLKLTKVKHDLSFLETCYNHHLFPKFLNFKLSIKRLQGSHLQRQFQRKLLDKEIKFKKGHTRKLEECLQEKIQNFRTDVSTITFHLGNYWVNEYNKKYSSKVKSIHDKKLYNLGYNGNQHPPVNNVIFNLSDRVLSETEKSALALGLNYCITPPKSKLIDYFLPFEKLAFILSNCQFYNKTVERESQFKSELKFLTNNSYKKLVSSNIPHNLPKHQYIALKKLSKEPDIVIVKPDKGNGVVILNTCDYKAKVKDILSDNTKFKVINNDIIKLTHKLENKVNRFLRTIKCKGIISEEEFKVISSSGSKPGILYGLPKIHKQDCPIRPIMSAISTHTYKMSKFIIPYISQWSKNEYTIYDSFSFTNEIINFKNNNYIMASFDIKSLYTNVPLNETINIILDQAFHNNSEYCKFDKGQLKKYLELSLLDNYFLFDKQLYKQLDGLAMGQPIAPILANIFLCYNEKKWLDNCPVEFKPVLYRRYMDDTFLLFRENNHINQFLNYLNLQHKSIKFTKEVERDNRLSFLDVDIKKLEDHFTSSIYRKPTFTGLTLNFSSFVPFLYKINLIKTLISRAYKLSSSYINFHKEIEKITSILSNNGFKTCIINKNLKEFINKLYYEKEKLIKKPEKQKIYIKVPFHGEESFRLRKNLKDLIKNYFPQITLNIIFDNNFNIKSFFKFKEQIPNVLKSNIIYKYKCDSCNATYIRKTSRHFSTRVKEHLGISVLSDLKLTSPPFSAIRNHILIKTEKPTLNSTESLNLKIL